MLTASLTSLINPYPPGDAAHLPFERATALQLLAFATPSSRAIPAIFLRNHETIFKHDVVTAKDNKKKVIAWAEAKGHRLIGSFSSPIVMDENWQVVAHFDSEADEFYTKDEATGKAYLEEIGLKLLKDEDVTVVQRITFDSREGMIDYTGFELDTSQVKIDPCLYPFIEGGPKQLIDDFMVSKAKVLMLIGAAGTGKSSLIQYMCSRFKNIMYGDDPMLFAQSVIAKTTEVLLDTSADELVVFEEIDSVISSRKADQNMLIPAILQATSGVITMGGKLVIVSNLEHTKNIDEALMRSSRCFKVVKFRNLTQEEANAAAVVLGVPPPKGEKDYSLAEITAGLNPAEATTMGFAA